MAWNGSNNQKVEKVGGGGERNLLSSTSNFNYKALIAGLVVLIGGVAAWLILGRARTPAAPQSAAPDSKIAEAKPQMTTLGGLMSPYTSLAELDDILVDMLPSDLAVNSDFQAGVFGITRFSCYTYKKACEEGWAPAPKNDYQKAIWEQVHALPTEPIKIKPETKKVEK